MRLMVGLFLLLIVAPALAQDSPGGIAQMEAEEARRASDLAIVRFNTHIKDFPSWETFQAAVLAQLGPDTRGICYTYGGGAVQVTMEPMPTADNHTGWRETSGQGWQHVDKRRRFIEYRFNEAAEVLLWIEGVKPRLFFAYTQKMCTVPLSGRRP